MDNEALRALLTSLAGHLRTEGEQTANELEQLDQALERALLPEDRQQLKTSHFAFE